MAILSLMTTMVDRNDIFTTSPVIGPTSIRSPTLMGRSINRMNLLTRLLGMFCRPKPTPRAPARMVKVLRSMLAV